MMGVSSVYIPPKTHDSTAHYSSAINDNEIQDDECNYSTRNSCIQNGSILLYCPI